MQAEGVIDNTRRPTNRRWVAALALTSAFLAAATASSAATLHVDNANAQCSDTGPGSSTTPFCTIGRGAAVAVAGDTVLVHSGSYTENVRGANSGTSAAPIVIRPAAGASVTVTSATRAFELSSKSWIRIEGFTVSGTVGRGISLSGCSNVTVASNVVTGAGLPVSGSTAYGIYVGGSTDCTVSGNNVHHNTDSGIYVTGGSIRTLVVGNVSSFNARGYARAATGIDIRSGGNTLRGNICHDNEDSGIQVYGVTGTPAPNNVLVNNVCYDNGDHGIDISSAGSQVLVGNAVYGSATSGINVEGASSGTLISNNISVDNAVGVGAVNLRVDAVALVDTIVDYDLFFLSQPSPKQIVWGASPYPSVAAFRSATGQEAHGLEANPQWVAPSQGNFHLSSTSPAIDSANSGATGALSTDLEGLPRFDDPATPNTGAGPRTYDDRGPYEYGSAATCGNGIREGGEACDGADLGGASCSSAGFFCGSGSGLSCNANCTLNTSTCVASCPATDACHTAGSCDAATDRCTYPAAPNGTACNDGNACTQSDTCQSGTCTGSNPVVCTASDQCHNAGTCNTSTGVCSNPAKSNGTACNDANACTQTDTCQSGTCTGSNPVVCTASDQCHVASCNPSTGACTNAVAPNGTACNDGNSCTQTDTCQSGTCTGSNPVVCTASDQCHTAGTCNTSTGVCSNPAKSNGTACNDANACTQTDTCQSGTCTGSNPVVCTASDQCHVGTCNTSTGACSNPAAPNGTACNDGNACTRSDTCQSGACTGANPAVCTASDACHAAGTCDTATGACSNPLAPDGTACNDGNGCTRTDACRSGTCEGSNPVVCIASDACHIAGTCVPSTGLCTNPAGPNGTPCNDGNACTQTDSCQSGTCSGSNPVVCTASDPCHVAGTCSPSTGACSNPAAPNGTTCNDGNACTRTDTCQSGACAGSNPVSCSASDVCHDVGVCDPATGVCSNPTMPDGTWCDHGNRCTHTDACRSGVCTAGTPVVCTASDACHDVGSCSSTTGLCSNPTKSNGTSCDDGNPCTTNDACNNGVCSGVGASLPGEVDNGVRLSESFGTSTITWNLASGSTSSDVLRGLARTLPVGPGGGDEACLENGIVGTSITDPVEPAPGETFWYLIRGSNGCGPGPYGVQTQGGVATQRISTTCP